MTIFEILLIGIALSMDAVAVSLSNGMTEPKMSFGKMLMIALSFGLFQFLMPLLGYGCSYAFSSLVEKIAPWLSFALLGILGGKMIVDFFKERRAAKAGESLEGNEKAAKLTLGKLLIQAIATSIDALAVGVTLLAVETTEGLPLNVALCALTIGMVTFSLSLVAVFAGGKVGNAFSDKAELLGGLILIGIGLKILIEGLI